MKFFIFFIIAFNYCQADSTLDGTLVSNYPFSTKLGYNEVSIFMENYITIYRLPDFIEDYSFVPEPGCYSGLEKGGIYHNSFYYTSCLKNMDSNDVNEFEIKACSIDTSTSTLICSRFPEDTSTYYNFYKSSSIRFFKISSEEELIGVAWRDLNNFYLLFLKDGEIKLSKQIAVSNIAK